MARSHAGRVLAAYLVGSVTGPLMVAIVKPHLRTFAKMSIVTGLRVRKMIAEAAEGFEGLAAEAVAEAQPVAAKTGSAASGQ